jgi:phosphate uptake regulator
MTKKQIEAEKKKETIENFELNGEIAQSMLDDALDDLYAPDEFEEIAICSQSKKGKK